MKKYFLAAALAININTTFSTELQFKIRMPETKASLTKKALLKSGIQVTACYLGTCLMRMITNQYKGSKDPIWNFSEWDEKSRLSFCTILGIILSDTWYEWYQKSENF